MRIIIKMALYISLLLMVFAPTNTHAQSVAGVNPEAIFEKSAYVTDDSYYAYYPNENCKHYCFREVTEVLVFANSPECPYIKCWYNDDIVWIKKKDISDKKPNYKDFYVTDNGRKRYMDWKCITNTASDQYKFQRHATTKYGIRVVGGRYCIAIGSHFTQKIGTKVDITLEKDGKTHVIHCVLGDCKANAHTDASNIYAVDGSITEFIVDTLSLNRMARGMGDVSFAADELQGRVVKLRVWGD